MLRDLMSTRVALTSPDTPVAEAAAGMVKANVGSAIVMQGRFLAGILTERDVLRSAASGENLRTARVSDWMTPIRSRPARTLRSRRRPKSCSRMGSAISRLWTAVPSVVW